MEKQLLHTLPLNKIEIKDAYWDNYISLVEKVILPFQWELINDRVKGAEKSYCIQNFKIAAKMAEGEHRGMVFQDTDVAKWLEAVAFSLHKKPNAKLEKTADEAIELIAKAQCEDGYINTYYTIRQEERWSDLFEGHELYTAGHLIEAAVAYYQATGKSRFLDVIRRFADYICDVFGPEEGKRHGYPGHPEAELALVKLYRATECRKYLDLAYYFIKTRGEAPVYFQKEVCFQSQDFMFPEFRDFGMDYCQAHKPLLEQESAEGHAVRALYLYSAMADLAYEYQDEALFAQCEVLFDNIVMKKMFITGSIGSAAYGERFTSDYDLPNNTNYSETCATIGLAMFANRMFGITKEGKYMDIVEQALYNTLLSGVAMDGKHFFYVNPLEVVPEIAEHNPTMRHIKAERQEWFGVACCPPNIARTLASMGSYMYAQTQECLYVNLYINSMVHTVLNGENVTLKQDSQYPYEGEVRISVSTQGEGKEFAIALRNPAFSAHTRLNRNGRQLDVKPVNGYFILFGKWEAETVLTLELAVEPRFVYCNPRVRDNIGKAAVMMGPIVYCLEEADNGKYLSAIRIDITKKIKAVKEESLLGGTICLELEAEVIDYGKVKEALYCSSRPETIPKTVKAIPYCLWNNRGKGEMLVWMRV